MRYCRLIDIGRVEKGMEKGGRDKVMDKGREGREREGKRRW